MSVQLPHNLETHRSIWRGLIAEKIRVEEERLQQYPGGDAILLYWKHELKAFDECFEKLDAQDVEFTL